MNGWRPLSLAISTILCLWAVLWAMREQAEVRVPDPPVVQVWSPPASVRAALPAPSLTKWLEPPSQSSGPAWIFDVFTPPIIFFHSEDQAFELTPPVRRGAPDVFELTPLQFERAVYRLQYAAHVGDEGRYVIEVRDVEGNQWVRGRVGQSLQGLDARIVSFDAQRQLTADEASGREITAINRIRLVLYDERLETQLTLGQGTRFSDQWSVVCEHPGGTQTLSMGEDFSCARAAYRIREMDTVTGRVRIERDPGDTGEPEVRLFELKPVTAVDSLNHLHQ